MGRPRQEKFRLFCFLPHVSVPVVQEPSEEFLSYVDSLISNNMEVPMEGSPTPMTCTGLFSCMISWMSNKARAPPAGCPALGWSPGLSPAFVG